MSPRQDEAASWLGGEFKELHPLTEDPDEGVLPPLHVGDVPGELTGLSSGLSVALAERPVLGGDTSTSAASGTSWSTFGDRRPKKMSVLVRYHKTELEVEADYETFAYADAFAVHGDNTLELLRNSEVIGFVHPERWDSVCTTEDADQAV